MLPLHRVVAWTLYFRSKQGVPNDDRVLFAAGHNFNKLAFCHANTGDVEISQVRAIQHPEAVPSSAWADNLAAWAGYSGARLEVAAADGVLCWFEAYAEALGEGRFGVEEIYPEVPHSSGICLFPRLPILAAVTHSIKVTASSLFIPELSHLDANSALELLYFFAYSIRFSLTSGLEGSQEEKEEADGVPPAPLTECQLSDRHWVIRNSAGLVESEVQGDGVIGLYPILRHGDPEFVYQSCTHQRDPEGIMGGDFTFVEGTLATPGPRTIKARCPAFRLQLPSIVFWAMNMCGLLHFIETSGRDAEYSLI
jgi:F-box protein 3